MADEEPPKKRLKRSSRRKKITSRGNNCTSRIKEPLKKIPRDAILPNYLTKRSLGGLSMSSKAARKTFINTCYSKNMKCVQTYDGRSTDVLHGAIFNIEFSPDNKYLVAACENSDVLIFDPCIQKRIHRVPNAHKDGVNCITFLDTRTFATCSDDKTIALWDIRNLNSKIITLKGHTSWIKSITYNSKSKQLISSGFDDTVRTWDVNDKYKDGTVVSKEIMNIPYLTRTKFSPDFSQMIVATTTGNLFVIHDLQIKTLKNDTVEYLREFVSSRRRRIQRKITKKPNRIESIVDFPSEKKPWCIASLQMHPSGKYILSRYTSQNASSEWSVVHNIQPSYGPGSNSLSRLHSYIEEPNLASGYIKELCYNDDGRVICSPFGNSIRLLAYTPNCDNIEYSECSKELAEIGFITSHKQSVLTTKFAYSLPILASGCLGGQVSFYQPRF